MALCRAEMIGVFVRSTRLGEIGFEGAGVYGRMVRQVLRNHFPTGRSPGFNPVFLSLFDRAGRLLFFDSGIVTASDPPGMDIADPCLKAMGFLRASRWRPSDPTTVSRLHHLDCKNRNTCKVHGRFR